MGRYKDIAIDNINKRRKRKVYRKKYIRRRLPNKNIYASAFGNGIPDTVFTKLRYYDLISLTTGTLSHYKLRMNSMYDPDETSILNHQPKYYDQLMAIWKKYTVYGMKVKLIFCNNSGNEAVIACMYGDNTTTNTSDIIDSIEKKYSTHKTISTGGFDRQYISKYFNLRKMIGKKIYDDDYSGTTSASPATQYYVHIDTINTDKASAIDITMEIEITYFCKLWDRAVIGQS